ncbi:outer membrane beta-barrel protein [Duganella sp. FT134W]|uniref:Outer membrane beta-barrel protein n=1 Tax=Duganella margarita TaxID=2692170 RepID=A0A7X4H5T7_9BURK|nr:outer membrane beta-barrel protein [Duganella margarita]MYM75260.1 outer membrane beta-barrel protein [Duganella margarita]
MKKNVLFALIAALAAPLAAHAERQLLRRRQRRPRRTESGPRWPVDQRTQNCGASDNRASPYISAGAAYVLNKNVSFVAEYEYFSKIAKDGDASIKANLVSVGVRYAF